MSNDFFAGPFIAGKDKYMIFIAVPSFEISIVGKKAFGTIKAKNIKAAKILAKKMLIEMGARFYDEVRNGYATTKS